MNIMGFFHTIADQPLYNVIVLFYNIIPGHDFGVSIIMTTVLIKLFLIPVSKKQIESQKKLQEIQPKIKEIQKKHKNDKEKQTREIMDAYKKNKANPVSGCLPLIIQMVFLIAIYRIIMNISLGGLTVNSHDLYSFIPSPGKINNIFFGIVDLSKPNIVIAFLAAAAQFYQTKMLMKSKKAENKQEEKTDGKPDFASMMNKQMLYLGPVLTLMIGIKFPAGLAIYWLVSTLFMIFQQIYVFKEKIPTK